MKVTSKIKTIFSEELLQRIAALCDTKRIPSNNQKMMILGNLLYTYGVEFEILGGATNRIALQIDGYAVKIAMDHQGYQDNLVEYSLSPELQPYVTKSYETNGYIQIQECVEVMTMTAFRIHFQNMRKILDSMCHDYLLGDVGTIEKNRTNWGLRDGQPVILDYAYCHRLSEELFTCEKCGMPLTYDNNYDRIMCSDTSACRASYSYNERKMIQGNQIDDDMIKERKSESIKLEKGVISKDIELVNDKIVGDNYFIIDSPADMYEYNKMKEEAAMQLIVNGGDEMISLDERLSAMIRLAKNPNDVKAKEILKSPEEDFPEPIYTDNYQERFMYGDDDSRMNSYSNFFGRDHDYDDDEEEDDIEPLSIGDMINKARNMGSDVFDDTDEEDEDDIEPQAEIIIPKQTEPKVEEPVETTETDETGESEPLLEDYEIGVNKEEQQEIKEPDPEPEKVEEPTETNTQSNVSNATIIINGKEIKEGEEIEV